MRVLSQRVPPRGDPDAAHRLARVQHVAETTPRDGLVHSVVLRAHCDVRLELLAHLVVGWSSPEPAAGHAQSACSVTIGSTRAASIAGRTTAASSATPNTTKAAAQDTGSTVATWKSCERIACVAPHESNAPPAAPAAIQRPASPITWRAISPGAAPNAIRTPISRVRCVTRYDATP